MFYAVWVYENVNYTKESYFQKRRATSLSGFPTGSILVLYFYLKSIDSSEAMGSWSPSPLIVGRVSFGLWTWARVQLRVPRPALMDVPMCFWYTIIHVLLFTCVYHIFITSPLCWLLVLSLYRDDCLQMFGCMSLWLHGCNSWWECLALMGRFSQ